MSVTRCQRPTTFYRDHRNPKVILRDGRPGSRQPGSQTGVLPGHLDREGQHGYSRQKASNAARGAWLLPANSTPSSNSPSAISGSRNRSG